MQRNKGSKIFVVVLSLLMVLSSLSINVFALSDDEVKLTIIHVNDHHGRMTAEPYISQMSKDLKAEGENVLILDAGDSLHGQTVTNLSKGQAMVEVMNGVGYDAMVLGNHDLNYGVERALELSKMMDFSMLAANIVNEDGDNLFESYKVFDMDNLKVGVFGIATPETVQKADPRIVADLTFEDPLKTAESMVDALEGENCDIIIALVHMGLDESSEDKNKSEVIASVSGIDVVIDGHSHTILENGKDVNGTLIAQTGEFGKNIGVVEITISGDEMIKTAKLVKVQEEESSELTADKDITSKIKEEEEKISSITSVVVGNTPVILDGARESVRVSDTNLSDVITDSMRYGTNADIAFLTGGNIRDSIEAGEITMEQVLVTLPFANLVATVELSGADVLEMLEYGVSKYPEVAAENIQISGVKFVFDSNAEPMNRVKKVTMEDGEELDVNKTYVVASNEFLIEGGDGYEMMKNGVNMVYYKGDAEMLAEYLETNPAISAESAGRRIDMTELEDVEIEFEEEITVEQKPELIQIQKPEPVLEKDPIFVPIQKSESAPASIQEPAAIQNIYVVKPGDNLSKISKIYNTTWQELQKINDLKNPNLIYPGQEIKISA